MAERAENIFARLWGTRLHRIIGPGVSQFRTNPLRTLLTLLGIVFGVASVVAMVSLGQGAQKEILAAIDAMGADLVHIKGKEAAEKNVADLVVESAGLSRADLLDVKQLLPQITAVAFRKRHELTSTDITIPRDELAIFGVSAGLFAVHRLKVKQGRALLEADHTRRQRVAIVGANVARRAFDGQAVGRLVRLEYAYFRIVGVLRASGTSNGGGDLPVDPQIYDDAVLIPFDTMHEELAPLPAYAELDLISLKVADMAQTLRAKQLLVPALQNLHGGATDFIVVAPEELLRQRKATQGILNLVLTLIAAISLVVGGIGVMNIMLANIMERISEIGLRRAVGARRRDIRNQFLLESISICVFGGICGIVLGLLLSLVVALFTRLPVSFAWYSVVLSFAISVAVGVLFGAMPAARAARVNPIEALQQ